MAKWQKRKKSEFGKEVEESKQITLDEINQTSSKHKNSR